MHVNSIEPNNYLHRGHDSAGGRRIEHLLLFLAAVRPQHRGCRRLDGLRRGVQAVGLRRELAGGGVGQARVGATAPDGGVGDVGGRGGRLLH